MNTGARKIYGSCTICRVARFFWADFTLCVAAPHNNAPNRVFPHTANSRIPFILLLSTRCLCSRSFRWLALHWCERQSAVLLISNFGTHEFIFAAFFYCFAFYFEWFLVSIRNGNCHDAPHSQPMSWPNEKLRILSRVLLSFAHTLTIFVLNSRCEWRGQYPIPLASLVCRNFVQTDADAGC